MYGFLTRTYSRLRHQERGFTVVESVIALAIIFVAMLALVYTATVGFSDIALSRQRQTANQIANKILEQVRGLPYTRVGQGLDNADQATDSQNIVSCPDGARYYKSCPSADPNAEIIVKTDSLPNEVPLVPHVRKFEPPAYPSIYTSYVYVTYAKNVPQAGAYRVIVHVTWTSSARSGAKNEVVTQSLLYTPEGTTDSTTGGGIYPFFYGTGSVSRAPITVTPNPGVSGGTGVTGLPSWDSVTEDLYGLDANVQQQQYAKAEGKAVMTGARKVVGGVETTSGGVSATSTADDDPATPSTTSDAPAGLTQSAVSTSVSGGGNSVDVLAASGTGPPCVRPPGLIWFTGVETGGINGADTNVGPPGGMFTTASAASGISVDSTVKRSGNYSLKITSSPTSASYAGSYVGPNVSAVAVRFGFRLASLPSSDVSFMARFETTSAGIPQPAFRYIASTQRLAIGFKSGTNPPVGVVSGPVVQAGNWYMIDMKVDLSSNPHTFEWRVDGAAQPSTSQAQDPTIIQFVQFGGPSGDTFTANYDDMLVSTAIADYPLPDATFRVLRPSAMGTNSFASNFQNDNNTAIDGNTYQRLDEIPASSSTDYVKQVTAASTGYVEVEFENPAEDCIGGVRALFSYSSSGNPSSTLKGVIVDGTTESCILATGSCSVKTMSGTAYWTVSGNVTPASAPWDNPGVSRLKARMGYSTDANPSDPYFHNVLLEYAAMTEGPGDEFPAGTETGSTASTTAASAGTPCGNPTQLDGRACSYAREDYSTAGPPHLSVKLNLTGSGAKKCTLFRFTPSTAPGSTSYVWARRTPGTGGAGTIKENAVRFYGTNEFGGLCGALGSGPAGWPGYWVKYDAGTMASQVQAEAGTGGAAPSYTAAGTISYWNGTGVSTMTQPPEGGAIPVQPVSYTSGGYRIEITGSLGSAPSQLFQNSIYEGRAVLGSPVVGTFTYKLTNTSSGAVMADVTVAVDLGTLTATARYAP